MNDLLSIASKTMENFDPAVDKVDDFENLPDGEYSCLLEDVTAKKSEETGNEWISIKFSVISGDYENRLLFVSYFFTEKTVERSIKGISKLAYDFGYEIPLVEIFSQVNGTTEQLKALAETLNAMAGNQATVKQTTSKSGYANYKVTPQA